MSLKELINENLILIDAKLFSKEEVIKKVCELLDDEGRILDKQLYLEDVFKREELGPTALGYDVAIPHAKSKGVKTSSLVFIKLKNEINWNGKEKVKYVFGIAVPLEHAGDEHLKILSSLARKIVRDEFRDGLINAKTRKEFLHLIVEDTL